MLVDSKTHVRNIQLSQPLANMTHKGFYRFWRIGLEKKSFSENYTRYAFFAEKRSLCFY